MTYTLPMVERTAEEFAQQARDLWAAGFLSTATAFLGRAAKMDPAYQTEKDARIAEFRQRWADLMATGKMGIQGRIGDSQSISLLIWALQSADFVYERPPASRITNWYFERAFGNRRLGVTMTAYTTERVPYLAFAARWKATGTKEPDPDAALPMSLHYPLPGYVHYQGTVERDTAIDFMKSWILDRVVPYCESGNIVSDGDIRAAHKSESR